MEEENKSSQIEENGGEQTDLHAYVPEAEQRRPSFYGFRRNYPEQESPTSTHTESFAQTMFKRRVRSAVLLSLLIIFTFLFSLIFTKTAINISKSPLPETTVAATSAPQTTA